MTCWVAKRPTISESSRCSSVRTMLVTDPTASTAASSTTEGMVDEKSLLVLSASSRVSNCLPTSTWAASATLLTPWSSTLTTS